MQDNTSESSTSITQLLRESYLAESSHQGNSERSRSEPSPHTFHCGNTSGTSDEVAGQDDLPDLSAFLSQEELDESVNLARQAINQDPFENKPDDQQIHVFYPSELKNSGNTLSTKQFQSTTSPASDSSLKKQQFGSEAESKKEFLNKAADFIEELSSLFKAHNSKRIRPRTCKNYRSKLESKNKTTQDSSFSDLSENRERPCVPVPQDLDKAEHLLEDPDNPEQADLEAVNKLGSSGLTTESAASCYSEESIVQPPHFTQKLKSREVPEGTKVQLDCIVVGIPAPEVRWYCEGKELENSPDIHIIQSGELHSLIIVEAFEEDTGRYSCFASNIYGTDSTSAEIYVEGASSSESESDTSKEEMDQFQKPTKISPNVPPPPAYATTTQQEAPKPQPSMAHPVSIPVHHVREMNMSQSPTNYLQGLDGRPIIAAPVFTKMLQDISASEGQLVVFECRVKGAPSPKVEWYREGTLIEDSPDFRILQKKPRSMAEPEEICTLVIAEVFSEDSGSFTCTASNKYGTVSSTARLTVKGPEDQNNTAALHTISSISLVAAEHQPFAPIPSLPLVDQLPKPKLEGVLVNHNEPRSSSKIGLRVHFKLPEDDKGSETSSEDGGGSANQIRPNCFPDKINGQILKTQEPTSPSKEPPPVLAKPKLDPTQLKQLHNQVMLEQQQIQQPSPPPPRELPFNTGTLNSATLPNQHQQQQPSSTMYKQNKGSLTQTFTYTRPKQFLASQNTTPTGSSSSNSPMPSFSNVPQGTQRIPNKENFLGSPPPVQTRSPGFTNQTEQPLTSPKEPVLPPLLLSVSSMNQFQPQNVPPTPLSPTGRIQNPVAFLSAVLPSLPSTPPTNAMGLPKSAPSAGNQGATKKNLRPLPLVTEDSIRDYKAAVVKDLEKRLHLRDEVFPHGQQRTAYDENLARRLQGPSNDTPLFNFTAQDVSKEYKISSFEQRLMNEIEFRLERTPVDESDDEIEHDEIPTGKCIAPIFDKRLKHFRVLEGYPATFTCIIVGIPVPKVYWFKDGKQISKKNEHYKMSREGDGTCSLHIEATTNDDDGNYTFMAANPQGRISCSGHLMVQTPPMRGRLSTAIQSHRGRSRIPEGDKEPVQERFFRPYFLQAPGDMVAHEGRLCRLDCKVSGLPPPDLMWLLNGRPVLPDTTHKMLVRETGVHSLLIDPLTQNDAGIYTCIATNKTGQNSFSLELSVVEKEVKKAPVILEKLQNCGVPEGHPVRLECRVIGMPPPVFYWKKDNDTIPPNRERMSMHQDATGYVCLLIQPAKKVDAGWYTLSAKNEAGIVSCTARLDIYAQWHQQIPQPIKIRPGGTRYANLTGQGLDIFSAFPAVENPVRFSSPSQPVVESEEL